MSRVLSRVGVWVAVVLTATLLAHPPTADAADPFVATGHSPTQGTPVPGAALTADLGSWSDTPDPDGFEFQWLRDGAPVAGATTRDYLVQPADVGHELAPYVTAHRGADAATFTGTPVTVRKIAAELRLDVRRVHPSPTQGRLVWTAVSFLSTERPWATDGGTVTAYKRKDGRLKPLGSAAVSRGAAFVRLPWKRAPFRRTKVLVCFAGTDVVADDCSRSVVVRRSRSGG